MADNNLVIGTLKALLTVDSASYEGGMRQASETAKKFSKDSDDVKKGLGGFDKVAATVGVALAGAFTVGAIISFGKKVLDIADNLSNLAQRTGISTTGLQKLDLAFQSSGVSIDSVSRAAGELGARLTGDKGAQELVKKLGLNLQELQKMKPEDQFIKVADAVGGIQNKGEQLYASKTLFGKGGVELLQGLTGNLKETTDQFEAMGLIIDEKTIKAADDFGDAMGLVGKQTMALGAQALAPLLPLLNSLVPVFMSMAKTMADLLAPAIRDCSIMFLAMYRDIANTLGWLAELATKVPIVGKHFTGLADSADWLRGSAASAEKVIASLTDTTKTVGTTAAATTPHLLGLGNANDEASGKAKKHAAELKKLQEEMAKFSTDEFRQTQALINGGVTNAVRSSGADLGRLWIDPLDEMVAKSNELNAVLDTTNEEMDRLAESQDFARALKQSNDEIDALIDGLKRAKPEASGLGSAFNGMFSGIQDGFKHLVEGMTGKNGIAGFMNNLGKGIVDGFGNILSAGLSSVISMGVNLAVEGIAKIGKLIGGLFQSEETKKVNGPRDQFFGQFGGNEGLASALTSALIDLGNTDAGNSADTLIKALYAADTERSFKDAEKNIADIFSAIGKPIRSFRNEGIVSSPTFAVIGDAPEPEYVLRQSTVRNLSGRGGLSGGGYDAAMRKALTANERAMRNLPRQIGVVLRDALAGV